jgi:hypothetical protein
MDKKADFGSRFIGAIEDYQIAWLGEAYGGDIQGQLQQRGPKPVSSP